MKRKKSQPEFVLCVGNADCDDLEVRKIYQVLPDQEASRKAIFESSTNQGKTICTQQTISFPSSCQMRLPRLWPFPLNFRSNYSYISDREDWGTSLNYENKSVRER